MNSDSVGGFGVRRWNTPQAHAAQVRDCTNELLQRHDSQSVSFF
jgi:hypothetical protein